LVARSDAFEIGDDLERGGDEPQIARDRLLEREQADTAPFEIEIQPVDLVVALDDLPRGRLVLPGERVESQPKAFEDDLAHVENVLAKRIELLLITLAGHTSPSDRPRNVLFDEFDTEYWWHYKRLYSIIHHYVLVAFASWGWSCVLVLQMAKT